MKPAAIHQLLAGFAQGDAISHEALAIREIARSAGFASDIFAPEDRIAPDAGNACLPLHEYAGTSSEMVIGHYSIDSAANQTFLLSPAKRILIYHNVTPPEFFGPFDPAIASQLTQARVGLDKIARHADAVWADSAFNASELREMGIPDVKVFPLLFQSAGLETPPDPAVLAKFAVPMKNILFVGRIAPNKCLSAYYQLADCFVTTSRHEGYCLPLVEAMVKGVPVVAHRTGGTPEAMGGAGVLFDDFTSGELAELLGLVCHDKALRQTVLASQQKRADAVLRRPVKDEFLALLSTTP